MLGYIFDPVTNEQQNTRRVNSKFKFTGLKRELTKVSALYNFFAVSLKRVDPLNTFLTKLGLIKHIDKRTIPGRGFPINDSVRSTTFEIKRLQKILPEGVPVIVLVAPARFELKNEDPGFKNLRLKMIKSLAKQGIKYVDVFDEFRSVDTKRSILNMMAIGRDLGIK